jgi:exoribonuclease R
MSWIAGTLEVASKVRYGLTTRGCPIFRFVPYDKRYAPFAVGSSIRDFSTNVHAIIEPSEGSKTSMPKGSIVQLLGAPSARTEQTMLLMTYAYDSKKEFRTILPTSSSIAEEKVPREEITGFTFHIDPPGCKDVDDAFTFAREGQGWRVHIHIADVDAWIKEDSPLDKQAKKKASTFYSTEGQALAPLFPSSISEESATLLPGSKKPAVSLKFHWTPGSLDGFDGLGEFVWARTTIETERSFTYDQADKEVDAIPELGALRDLSESLGQEEFSLTDSHTWVQALMILYNQAAGSLLRQKKVGILRRHSAKKLEKFQAIGLPIPMAAAEYVLADDENVEHGGLKLEAYAYASSPIRRYCDLVNQRIIKNLMDAKEPTAPTKELVDELNRRQKQEKAFTRDMFFMGVLSSKEPVQGIAMSDKRVWIPAWKRAITVRNTALTFGKSYTISWYENKQLPHWKDRIVFRAVYE